MPAVRLHLHGTGLRTEYAQKERVIKLVGGRKFQLAAYA